MTTAGRPTWDSAKGGHGRWENDLSAMSKQYSVRDLPGHTKLKVRQEGQGRPEDLSDKDFKRTLEEKEKRAVLEKAGKGHMTSAAALTAPIDKRPSTDSSAGTGSNAKRSRLDMAASVSTANLDADDPWDEDYNEDEDETPNTARSRRGNGTTGGGEANESGDEQDDEESDDEDEALLLAELAKIKRERAVEASKLAVERKTAEETIRMENILKGNPLLQATGQAEFKVKRRWDDDVVFKNCARGEADHVKRGFINDTLRTEFHRKFMRKYIQ